MCVVNGLSSLGAGNKECYNGFCRSNVDYPCVFLSCHFGFLGWSDFENPIGKRTAPTEGPEAMTITEF